MTSPTATEKRLRSAAGGAPAPPAAAVASGPGAYPAKETVRELGALLELAPAALVRALHEKFLGCTGVHGDSAGMAAAIVRWVRDKSRFYVYGLCSSLREKLGLRPRAESEADGGDDGESEGNEDGGSDEPSLADILSRPTEPVDVEQLAELLVGELYRLRVRCEDAEAELDRLKFSFDFSEEDDCAVTVRSARRDARDAIEGLEGLSRSLCQWLNEIRHGRASVVALGDEAMSAARTLGGFVRTYRREPTGDVTDSALRHLAESPNAASVLADFERRRLEAHSYAGHPNENDRKRWPFVRLDGTAWNAKKDGPRTKARPASRKAKGNGKSVSRAAGRRKVAAARPGR